MQGGAKLSTGFDREPMLEMFVFETTQLIEQLELIMINSEKTKSLNESDVNEIFRIMHTIKGSSAMMMFNNISKLAHSVEDLFFYIRENKNLNMNYSKLVDIVLGSMDFIKTEMVKIQDGLEADGDVSELEAVIKGFLSELKSMASSEEVPEKNEIKESVQKEQKFYIPRDKIKEGAGNNFYVEIHFEEDCEMENIRAFTVIHNLKSITEDIMHIPEDIIESDDTAEVIKKDGFKIYFKSAASKEEIETELSKTIFLKSMRVELLDEKDKEKAAVNKEKLQDKPASVNQGADLKEAKKENKAVSRQSIINVNVDKIDKLLDLLGELVISEAMVIQNPDLTGLQLDNFQKASRQLRKITDELQDIVMSIRMVPLSSTFQKMNRIVRDMSKKLNKEVELELIGEETEVDKNIIENISDPLMHLIRNSIDHGIEEREERLKNGKAYKGKITLEAKNSGGDVWIFIKDDGSGINKEKVLKKAREHGLINKPDNELSDKEIYACIFMAGFSTKDEVSEYSGRGVGMDVVVKNIEKIGGKVFIDSESGKGTTISIKIPLTLAIIDGMNIRVGNSRYTIPINLIKESFRLDKKNLILDPHGQEITVVRGQSFNIIRLHELFNVKTNVKDIDEGIIVMVEDEEKRACIFADELLGQQQVVVKALPSYIKKVKGIAGCTLLGDGAISLILDVPTIINY